MTLLEIANLSLLRVGNNILTSLDEDSTDAQLVNTLLDPSIKEVLREGYWSSALTRSNLVQNVDKPAFQYEYSFALPADLIRLVQVYDAAGQFYQSNHWKIEGKNLLTDLNEVNISYIHIPEDIDTLDHLCAQAIVNKLAMKLAYPKTENEKLVTSLTLEYEQITAQRAKSIDAIENFEESEFGEVSWIAARNYTYT